MILNEMFHALLWILTVISKFCLADLPQKPVNMDCEFYYSESEVYTLTCRWIPIKEGATYTLIRKGSDGQVKNTCVSQNGSCSLVKVPYLVPYHLELLNAENKIEEKSLFKPEEILKPDPPQISSVEPIAGMKQILRVSWKRPRKTPGGADVKCQIHYTATTKNHTNDTIVTNSEEYNLTNLWDFTNYTVALRCTLSVSNIWSEWSSEKIGRTEEQAPLRVDLWRVIESEKHTENRIVHLLWKECKEFPCSGIINGYRVKYFSKSNASFEYTTSDNSVTVNLTKDAYVINVTAFNEAGESPEATLRIPSIHEEKERDHIISLKASALEKQMLLEWKPLDLEINNYIIEWYYEPNSMKRSWQKITNTTKWTSPKGAFICFKYYYISVYPFYKGEIKTPHSIRTYFHEGIPAEGPSPEAVNVDKNEATIKWKEIPEAKRNGCIISYTIFFKAEDGQEFGETVNSSILQYQPKSLQANTKYIAQVMASTIAGGKNGTTITFITSKLSVVDIILINVIVGLFMLCLLTIGILGAVKRDALKNALWPKIPYPYITTILNKDQQPISLRNSPSIDESYPIILEVQSCSKDRNKLELLNSEDCLKETDDATKNMAVCEGILSDRKHEAFPPTSFQDNDFRSPTLPTTKRNSLCYENQEVQDQLYLKPETKFNPYLKNTVSAKEFLVPENLDQNTEGTNTQPVPVTSFLLNSTEQPYVALDNI